VAIVVAGPGLAAGEGVDGLLSIGEVLLTAVLYAIAPFVIATKLRGVPSLGTISLSLLFIGVGYLPIAFLTQHEAPTLRSIGAVTALTVICTAVAFLAFFALIAEVGPARAPLFTYVNPIVAIALGVVLLREEISPGLLLGVPLVIVGCWLAATGGGIRIRRKPHQPPAVPAG
jgi:drug/metabolite transporter (DMT)-like permease